MVKNLPAMQKMQETQVRSLGGKDSLEKSMATHSSTLAWRIHEQRSLVIYSPWGRKEPDMTEVTEYPHVEKILFSYLKDIILSLIIMLFFLILCIYLIEG